MAGDETLVLSARDHIVTRLRRAKAFVRLVQIAPVIWSGLCVLPLAWVEVFGSRHGDTPAEDWVRNASLPVFVIGVISLSWAQPALLRAPRPWFKERWRFSASVAAMIAAFVALFVLAMNGGRWPASGASS